MTTARPFGQKLTSKGHWMPDLAPNSTKMVPNLRPLSFAHFERISVLCPKSMNLGIQGRGWIPSLWVRCFYKAAKRLLRSEATILVITPNVICRGSLRGQSPLNDGVQILLALPCLNHPHLLCILTSPILVQKFPNLWAFLDENERSKDMRNKCTLI